MANFQVNENIFVEMEGNFADTTSTCYCSDTIRQLQVNDQGDVVVAEVELRSSSAETEGQRVIVPVEDLRKFNPEIIDLARDTVPGSQARAIIEQAICDFEEAILRFGEEPDETMWHR